MTTENRGIKPLLFAGVLMEALDLFIIGPGSFPTVISRLMLGSPSGKCFWQPPSRCILTLLKLNT